MAGHLIIRPLIVICLLSAAVLLGGCSPPVPKTWLPPPGGTMYDTHLSSDRGPALTASPLKIRR